jgi:hypothetical protein
MQPRWVKGDTNWDEQRLMLDHEHAASVMRNQSGGWGYNAGNTAHQIPYNRTRDDLPGFKDANTAKRAAFVYVSKHIKPLDRKKKNEFLPQQLQESV